MRCRPRMLGQDAAERGSPPQPIATPDRQGRRGGGSGLCVALSDACHPPAKVPARTISQSLPTFAPARPHKVQRATTHHPPPPPPPPSESRPARRSEPDSCWGRRLPSGSLSSSSLVIFESHNPILLLPPLPSHHTKPSHRLVSSPSISDWNARPFAGLKDVMATFNPMSALSTGASVPDDAMTLATTGQSFGMEAFDGDLTFDESLL
jgi:hypothetical protein